jgi:hypothetical protein
MQYYILFFISEGSKSPIENIIGIEHYIKDLENS